LVASARALSNACPTVPKIEGRRRDRVSLPATQCGGLAAADSTNLVSLQVDASQPTITPAKATTTAT